jgi:4-carboxymuconolactone decarboxylase
MRLFIAMLPTLLLASAATDAQTLSIARSGSRPIRPAPADNFTGTARVDTLFETQDPLSASAGSVSFEPGARTAWHSHPAGQILIVTAGTGRVQQWGHRVEEIRTGDVVRIPPGQKHWHGASPQTAMTHIAITEPRNGRNVQWMEQVSDEQFAAAPSAAETQASQPPQGATRPSGPVQQRVAPGLATLTDDILYGDVWRRPELSLRDRSLVTISALIAMGKPAQLAGHLGRALDNGVRPSEASGVLAHLAIYSGWPNAVSALQIYDEVYTARKVDTSALHTASSPLSAPTSDAARAKAVTDEMGSVAPKFAALTNDVVFGDLWRRSDLTPRDRSLVTIAALAAMGDEGELEMYIRRGLQSGLTEGQTAEALTHLGFYAGWPKAAKALRVVKRIIGK